MQKQKIWQNRNNNNRNTIFKWRIFVIVHPDHHTADLTAAQQEFTVSNIDCAVVLSSEAVRQN